MVAEVNREVELEHHTVATNGIHLHVVQAGPPDGPLVILLHGFPEFWYGWQRQITDLAARGFRVWAPDQRGYNLSDRPQAIGAYRLNTLAQDIVGLIDAAGREKAYVAGHDWGAEVAWWLALEHADRLHRVAMLNVPHPTVMRQHVFSSLSQLRKSWYIFFFQLSWLPEAAIRRDDWSAGARALRGSSRRGTFTDADLAEYRRAWSQPGALTGMLNWYRAIARRPPPRLTDPYVHIPTLVIWGAQDMALDVMMASASVNYCEQGRLVLIPDATHWVQHEEPERVSALLAEHFGAA
jgi:epoxide hydrolase 4